MPRFGAAILLLGAAAGGDPTCWTGEVTEPLCCDLSKGPTGDAQCWDPVYTFERCCGIPAVAPVPAPARPAAHPGDYPYCVESNVVLRSSGEHAVFVDVSTYGSAGCFQNDCKKSDKFNAQDRGVCGRLCAEVEECTHWSFGEQDGAAKCFLRGSDGGREHGAGWSSGAKPCSPPPLPAAFAASATAWSAGLLACDGGKGSQCPDVLAAVNTWNYAIEHLKRAAVNRVDESTQQTINTMAAESANFARQIQGDYRPSDADFPRIVFNNRLIFKQLRGWLDQHPKVELSATDATLPTPLRTGGLCGRTSCYEL